MEREEKMRRGMDEMKRGQEALVEVIDRQVGPRLLGLWYVSEAFASRRM